MGNRGIKWGMCGFKGPTGDQGRGLVPSCKTARIFRNGSNRNGFGGDQLVGMSTLVSIYAGRQEDDVVLNVSRDHRTDENPIQVLLKS
jgi:hypothetical protein